MRGRRRRVFDEDHGAVSDDHRMRNFYVTSKKHAGILKLSQNPVKVCAFMEGQVEYWKVVGKPQREDANRQGVEGLIEDEDLQSPSWTVKGFKNVITNCFII
ncbi:hypothetical protein RUM44_005371 [Polyplax serrata]|uniref:Uncharacterized protein n=1 Tax=Polyplax serrata TaxID=468196 RepID=A0ABR1AEM8_POLSC